MSESNDQQGFPRANDREPELRGEASRSGVVSPELSSVSSAPFADSHAGFGNQETAAAGVAPLPAGSYHGSPHPFQAPVNRAVAGPFTVRDLFVIGCSIAILLISLIPSQSVRGVQWFLMWSDINWIGGFIYVGGVVAVGALFVIRRIAPHVPWAQRIGSFSTDQLASVVAVYSAIDWFSKSVVFSYVYISGFNVNESSVGIALLGFLFAMAYVVVTVCAPHIPRLRDDFDVRPEEIAHRVARTIVPAIQAPKIEFPVVARVGVTGNPAAVSESHGSCVSEAQALQEKKVGNATSYAEQQPHGNVNNFSEKPFWFAVAEETEVFDEQTQQVVFVLKTGVWYLALQDRGAEFLVTDHSSLNEEKSTIKHGILKDIEGVERA